MKKFGNFEAEILDKVEKVLMLGGGSDILTRLSGSCCWQMTRVSQVT